MYDKTHYKKKKKKKKIIGGGSKGETPFSAWEPPMEVG